MGIWVGAVWVGLVVVLGCSGDKNEADAVVPDGTVDADAEVAESDTLEDGVDAVSSGDGDARDADDSGVGDIAPVDPSCLGPVGSEGSDSASVSDALGVASVTIDSRAACLRTYRLSSTAVRRDDLPASPRVLVERAAAPRLRTGHDLFDAAYALAVDEVRECSVSQITDGSFNGGQPLPCPAGGCFETGRKWPWVWTRDTSYAIHLGLAMLDPVRAKNSLIFKLSERRSGGGVQVVQDTGSGGAWPVSTDRVVWALGARAVLGELVGAERTAFRDLAIEALTNTIEQDRRAVWDSTSGLYFGEQSFLDWREQSYPLWTRNDVIDVATSRTLSTNVLHFEALKLLSELLVERGDSTHATRYSGFADALRLAIDRLLWVPEHGAYAAMLPSQLDPAPVKRFDLLGSALAILGGVASPDKALAMLASYPSYGPAVPVIWPQQQLTAIYHNRASWPFVTAYWLAAARVAERQATATGGTIDATSDGTIDATTAVDGTADHLVTSLWEAAVLNLSNLENLEGRTGAPWLDDGAVSGPVVNSQRQLWSVAGYVGMVHHVLFGLKSEPEGLRVEPWLTRGMRDGMFAGTDELVLVEVPHRGRRLTVRVGLPAVGRGGRFRVATLKVDGQSRAAGEVIPLDVLRDGGLIEVELTADSGAATRPMTTADAASWREVFSPRTPAIAGIGVEGGKLKLALRTTEEDKSGLVFEVWRDGIRVASELPGTTESWVDTSMEAATEGSPCYVVEARFASGLYSQRSRATCWWGVGDAHIRRIEATAFVATGGTPVTEHERFHYQGWGDLGHRLEIRDIVADRTAMHLFQVAYGNGAGPVTTGIGCGTKRLTVTDRETGLVVADGMLVMPQLGRWDRWALSNFVEAELVGGRRYDVVISADEGLPNMSDFKAFETYRAFGTLGGVGGPFNRVNISELRVLRR